MSSVSSASTLDRISLYLGTCFKLWIGLYLAFCALVSLKSLMLHVAAIGLLLCLLSYFRLPASEPNAVFKLLGRDPLNLDGSPSRTLSRGVLGLIAHRAAPLDAPENSVEAVKKAKKAGAKTIHCNLTFTSDGIAVALRPRDLKELQKDMDSNPQDMTYKEIQDKLDLATNHPLSGIERNSSFKKKSQVLGFFLDNLFIFLIFPENSEFSLFSF